MNWLTENKIPLGKWIESFVDFINEHAAWLFELTSDALGFLIEGFIHILQWTPALLLVAIFSERESHAAFFLYGFFSVFPDRGIGIACMND